MIDLHCHILPGLDDGAKDAAEAVEMARQAVADGIRTVIATPHHRNGKHVNGRAAVEEAVRAFEQRLKAEGVPLTVLPGQELHCDERVIEALYDDGEWLPLGGSKYVLLEFPSSDVPEHAAEVVHELAVLGCVPVIAHPERNRRIAAEPGVLRELVEAGALAQVTSLSLVGRFGPKVRKLAADLCKQNLIHFVASDAHNCGGRPFLLQEAYRWVREELGESYEQMYLWNAEAVVAGDAVEKPEPVRKNRSWWRLWTR